MGIHTWTGYTNFEDSCCEGIKTLLNLFCFECHTPDDVAGCHKCEIGRANLMMLDYLKKTLKKNKHLDKLVNAVENEEDYYCWRRLRSHFRPKKPKKEYIEKVKKSISKCKDNNMINLWAKNTEECAKINDLLDKLKKAETKL